MYVVFFADQLPKFSVHYYCCCCCCSGCCSFIIYNNEINNINCRVAIGMCGQPKDSSARVVNMNIQIERDIKNAECFVAGLSVDVAVAVAVAVAVSVSVLTL